MPDPVFETVSNLEFSLITAGASKKFEMAYKGTTQAAEAYGGDRVGPEAWKSKTGDHILLAFRGTTETQYALIEQDPEADPDPIPDYMSKYGDNLLDATEVSRVNWQKIVAGDQWSENASPGVSINPEGYLSWALSYNPSNTNLNGTTDVMAAVTNGVDTPQDTKWLTPAAGQAQYPASNWPHGMELLKAANADMAHPYIWKFRIRARLRCPDLLSGLYIILYQDNNSKYQLLQTLFTSGSSDWENIDGQVFNVYPIQIEAGQGDNPLSQLILMFNAFGPTPVDISEIEVQYETAP